MLMSDFLMTRKSIRTFKNKKLDPRTVGDIQILLDRVNAQMQEDEFLIYTNADDIFKKLEGKAGYGGVMVKAPAYIAMLTKEETPEAYMFGAYYLEKVITQLKQLNLGSCWVTLSNMTEEDLKSTFKNEMGQVRYVLAIGYPPRDLNMGKSTYSGRIGVEEYVFKGELGNKLDMEELEHMGLADLFYYLRMAPSSYNKQPWRFVIDSEKISIYAVEMENPDEFVDMGIVMFYFDELAKTIGIRPEWDINVVREPGKPVYIGEVKI